MRSSVDFGKNHKLPAVSPAYWKLAETASKVELLQRIDVLEEENQRLKAEVARLRKDQNREVRTAREKPFGNDTPSSKVTFKPDAEVTRVANRGGATKGHEGHGRKRSADVADETVAIERPQTCDRCGERLVDFKVEERTVRIAVPPHYRTLRYLIKSGWCESCNRQVSQKVRGVLPRFSVANPLLAQNVMDRFVYGMTVGTISARMGIGKSTLFNEYARLSEILKPCTERLLELYRLAPVKGADETTWRCDGQNGYVYGFFTQDVALFRFRGTRKMCVAEEVFGEGDHIGVLVRDRFPGYDNSFKGKQQYCFEHLKRDCKELLEKEPQNAEYQKFVPAFVSLLREAMQLRGRGLEDDDYYEEAKRIKDEMLKMINAQAKDPGLQKYQDIFRRHPERIFQWAENRSVPAENNMSERGVRRTVIARKVCGGSQSKDALMVREVLQSVIESLRLRYADPVAKLTEALDAYAMDSRVCIPDMLFPLPTHQA